MAEKKEADSQDRLFVTFLMGEDLYGVSIMDAQEIIRMMPVTRVPNAPDFVEGVINLRGNVIPVLDLRKRFKITEARGDDVKEPAVVVIKVENITVGIIIDKVSGVLHLKESDVKPTAPGISPIGEEYIAGVGQLDSGLVILLDAARLLTNPEKGLLQGSLTAEDQ